MKISASNVSNVLLPSLFLDREVSLLKWMWPILNEHCRKCGGWYPACSKKSLQLWKKKRGEMKRKRDRSSKSYWKNRRWKLKALPLHSCQGESRRRKVGCYSLPAISSLYTFLLFCQILFWYLIVAMMYLLIALLAQLTAWIQDCQQQTIWCISWLKSGVLDFWVFVNLLIFNVLFFFLLGLQVKTDESIMRWYQELQDAANQCVTSFSEISNCKDNEVQTND